MVAGSSKTFKHTYLIEFSVLFASSVTASLRGHKTNRDITSEKKLKGQWDPKGAISPLIQRREKKRGFVPANSSDKNWFMSQSPLPFRKFPQLDP